MIRPRLTHGGLRSAHRVLAGGLAVSAVLVAVLGGWPGAALGAAQLAVAIAVLSRPARPAHPPTAGLLAIAALALLPAPLAELRHWTARSPIACKCLAASSPAPGLVSLTGLLVLTDLSLAAFAIFSARAERLA